MRSEKKKELEAVLRNAVDIVGTDLLIQILQSCIADGKICRRKFSSFADPRFEFHMEVHPKVHR